MASPLASLAQAETEPRIALAQLVRLRWVAVVGQLASLAVAGFTLGLQLPWVPLLALVAGTACSNLWVLGWLRLRKPTRAFHVGAVLALDVLLLTGLLACSGGSANPFSILYLVHVTLAALVLRASWSFFLGLLSLACYGLLFFVHVHVHELSHGHHDGMSLHLQGMWVAFAVAAGLIGWFATETRSALHRREEELQASRERSARYQRLAAVGTLAAGAAHELGTPLGTIAVAAREMERSLSDPSHCSDARLIREQVDRCQAILSRLRERAGAPGGEDLAPAPLGRILDEVVAALPAERRERLGLGLDPALAEVQQPRGVLVRTLRDLLANAFDASPPNARVELSVTAASGAVAVVVRDRGAGMAAEVLARAGEPFFTTKEPGRGMGLGLHLALQAAEQLGGELSLASTPGDGTSATLLLPERAA